MQWSKEGYHYPIQVAQYGLSHHAKHVISGDPDQVVLEDGEEDSLGGWVMPDTKSQVKVSRDEGTATRVLEFLTSGNGRQHCKILLFYIFDVCESLPCWWFFFFFKSANV